MKKLEKRIAVVVGSIRPTRTCLDVATQVCELLERHTTPIDTNPVHDVLELGAVGLLLLDEPLMASMGRYACPHAALGRDR